MRSLGGWKGGRNGRIGIEGREGGKDFVNSHKNTFPSNPDVQVLLP